MLNKEELERHIKEIGKRCDIAYSFQEPDRVPISISEGGSYWSKMFEYNIKDYYSDFETKIDVQEKGLLWRFENLKDDRNAYAISFDMGPIAEALVFDCPIEYHDDTSPRIVPILKDISDIEKLRFIEEFCKFKEIAEKKKTIFPVQSTVSLRIHPPLSAACAIMDPVLVYTYMYTEPEMIKKFFDKMMEAFFKVVDYFDNMNKTKTTGLWLADDNSCSISGEMYKDMVVKYVRTIYEKYGKSRYLHTDGPSDHLFPVIADELNLTIMDIGGFSNIESAVKYLKGKVVIHGGLNNKDLYQGLTDETKEKIDNAIKIAASGGGYEFAIGGETYPGIAPQILVELVKYVKEKGKYKKSS